MTTPTKTPKTKKSDTAFAIYAKNLPKRDTMKKREFRAMVIEQMSKELGVTNKGTLGGYYSWSEQVITGRPAKVYSRGDGARARKGSHVDEKVDAELTRLSNSFSTTTRKAAKKNEGGSFGGGFGSAAL